MRGSKDQDEEQAIPQVNLGSIEHDATDVLLNAKPIAERGHDEFWPPSLTDV